jgi:transposase
VLPKLADQLLSLRHQRGAIAARVETGWRLPLTGSTSKPGIGVRTCARILTEVTGRYLASAVHLSSYAGIAPVTRRSGTSIRSEHTSRRGNKKLERALFFSAFAALPPLSRVSYDRKRAEGKRHQALTALAHRRSDVLLAVLRAPTHGTSSWPDENHRGTAGKRKVACHHW